MTTDEVREAVMSLLRRDAARCAPGLVLAEDTDLIGAGVYDSMGFVDALGELETRLGCEIDLSEHGPDEYTHVGGLVRTILLVRGGA